jgi:hypothetical protein
MIVYPQEVKDDLGDFIAAANTVTIASIAEPSQPNLLEKAKASHHLCDRLQTLASYDDKDLYYVQSILVSSSWNKNDDVFTKEEVWAAKRTPEDKPTNLEHNEGLIIGHIVANWPINEDGQLLDENISVDNLPEKFHLVTGSVIYRAFSTPELKERAEKLIAEIEAGTKYVSMECMFGGFDYGLINNTTGEYKILARSNDTAFLTKHLRAYGGKGEYDNHKIGRVLRNITFSGKGYVDRPANPDSIIFTKENFIGASISKNTEIDLSGVSEIRPNYMETNIMNPEELTTELNEKIASLEAALKAEQEAHSALKNEVAEAAQTAEAANTEKEAEINALKAEKISLEEALAAYKNKEEEMMKKEKKMKRMASLLENGLEEADASAAVEKFESLEDEAFDAMVALVTSATKKAKMQPKMEETKVKSEEATETVEDALDNAEPNTSELDLSAGSDASEGVNTTRAALVDFVCARLGKKLNKGE